MRGENNRSSDVTTKALNQAVKRNQSRFPVDFAFQLTRAEMSKLKSQYVTSKQNTDGNQRDKMRWSQFVTTSQKYAFVRLREHVAANAAILKRLAEIDQTLLQHDAALRDVYRKLQPLLAPPAGPSKRRIGF